MNNAIDAYLRNMDADGKHYEKDDHYEKLIEADRKVAPGDTDNPLSKRIKMAVAAIEDVARPHVRREG